MGNEQEKEEKMNSVYEEQEKFSHQVQKIMERI